MTDNILSGYDKLLEISYNFQNINITNINPYNITQGEDS